MLFSIEFVIANPWRPEPEIVDVHNIDCNHIGRAELEAESILATTDMARRPDGYRILQGGKVILARQDHSRASGPRPVVVSLKERGS